LREAEQSLVITVNGRFRLHVVEQFDVASQDPEAGMLACRFKRLRQPGVFRNTVRVGECDEFSARVRQA
jgi:hypothetical protein